MGGDPAAPLSGHSHRARPLGPMRVCPGLEMFRQQRSTLYQVEKERLWKRGKKFSILTAIPGPIPHFVNTRCTCFHFALGLANNTAFYLSFLFSSPSCFWEEKRGHCECKRFHLFPPFCPSEVCGHQLQTFPKIPCWHSPFYKRQQTGTRRERGWERETCHVAKTWLEFLVRSSLVCEMFFHRHLLCASAGLGRTLEGYQTGTIKPGSRK